VKATGEPSRLTDNVYPDKETPTPPVDEGTLNENVIVLKVDVVDPDKRGTVGAVAIAVSFVIANAGDVKELV
jgi:hypothetical protein